MNSDIRLSIGWNQNPKIVKLRRKLGADGVLGLITLWTYVGGQRADGVLTGMDDDDIAIVADYPGDSARFVATLAELRLIEKHGNDWAIHDWQTNNPWAAGHPARAERARKAVLARWNRRNPPPPDPENGEKNTPRMETDTPSMPNHTPSNTPSPFLSSPSPSPKDMILTDHGDSGESPPAPSAKVVNIDSTPYDEILALYHQTLPDLRAVRKLTPARKNAIRAAWRGDLLGPKLPAWQQFFEYIRDDCPFLSGRKPDKDGRAFHADLEWLMKPANLVKVVEGKYEEEARRG
jgi:hypothetical protein